MTDSDRDRRLRLGISSCLLGEEVRWDGGHRRLAWLAEGLGEAVDWVRVCPEVAIGLGVPREPIELVQAADGLRLLGVESRRDHTEAMAGWARAKAAELADLDGYVFKARSPSCGVGGVPVAGGAPGRGLFAEALARTYPNLPIVDEERLADRRGRERFLQQATEYRRARAARDGTRPDAPSARSRIALREIDASTVRAICDLAVRPDQRRFVAPNAVSIAQAYFSPHAWFRAIYADSTLVGFLMLEDRPQEPEYYLWRFMIDARFQGMGFGRRAIDLLVEHVRTRPNATELLTSVLQAEGGPQGFYEALGFELTGEYEEGEALMSLRL